MTHSHTIIYIYIYIYMYICTPTSVHIHARARMLAFTAAAEAEAQKEAAEQEGTAVKDVELPTSLPSVVEMQVCACVLVCVYECVRCVNFPTPMWQAVLPTHTHLFPARLFLPLT
jgi:hypothetical protein